MWDHIAADGDARAVVLTGRGRAFSAGGDFHVMKRVQRDEAFREQNIAEARSIITGMVRCPVPVVTAVNGPAVGLGCSLALLSDMVLIAAVLGTRIRWPRVGGCCRNNVSNHTFMLLNALDRAVAPRDSAPRNAAGEAAAVRARPAARHNGHADLLRKRIDGATGE